MHLLPRLRPSPLSRLARSGRFGRATSAEPSSPSPEAQRCIRRNERKAQRRRERAATCRRGHPMTPENLYQPADRGIQCRLCRNATYRARRNGVSVDQLLQQEVA